MELSLKKSQSFSSPLPHPESSAKSSFLALCWWCPRWSILVLKAAHQQPPQHKHSQHQALLPALWFTCTFGLFPVLGKTSSVLLFFPLNNNQGKKDVPEVREESRRAHEGAYSKVLLSFMFQVSHEIGCFIRAADEDLKLLRTVQFLAKLDSNCSGLL